MPRDSREGCGQLTGCPREKALRLPGLFRIALLKGRSSKKSHQARAASGMRGTLMSSRPSWPLTRAIHGAFTERRIYIRTGGKTRYLSIRPASQICATVAFAALLGWTGFTTTAFVTSALDGHSARASSRR
jgi:hypothetical protein